VAALEILPMTRNARPRPVKKAAVRAPNMAAILHRRAEAWMYEGKSQAVLLSGFFL